MAVGGKWGRKSILTQIIALPLIMKCGPLCLSFPIENTLTASQDWQDTWLFYVPRQRALQRGRSLWTRAGKKVTSLAHHRGPLWKCVNSLVKRWECDGFKLVSLMYWCDPELDFASLLQDFLTPLPRISCSFYLSSADCYQGSVLEWFLAQGLSLCSGIKNY